MANFPFSDERAWTLDERIRLTLRCYPVVNHTLGTHWRATGNDRGGVESGVAAFGCEIGRTDIGIPLRHRLILAVVGEEDVGGGRAILPSNTSPVKLQQALFLRSLSMAGEVRPTSASLPNRDMPPGDCP